MTRALYLALIAALNGIATGASVEPQPTSNGATRSSPKTTPASTPVLFTSKAGNPALVTIGKQVLDDLIAGEHGAQIQVAEHVYAKHSHEKKLGPKKREPKKSLRGAVAEGTESSYDLIHLKSADGRNGEGLVAVKDGQYASLVVWDREPGEVRNTTVFLLSPTAVHGNETAVGDHVARHLDRDALQKLSDKDKPMKTLNEDQLAAYTKYVEALGELDKVATTNETSAQQMETVRANITAAAAGVAVKVPGLKLNYQQDMDAVIAAARSNAGLTSTPTQHRVFKMSVAYESAAVAFLGADNLEQNAMLQIQALNLILANSKIPLTIELDQVQVFTYPGSTVPTEALGYVASNVQRAPTSQSLMSIFADSTITACGWSDIDAAKANGLAATVQALTSIVALGCSLALHSFSHEFGHTIGGQHQLAFAVAGWGVPYGFAFAAGPIDNTSGYPTLGTVLAYIANSADRFPTYSSPAIKENGMTVGSASVNNAGAMRLVLGQLADILGLNPNAVDPKSHTGKNPAKHG